MSKSMPLPTPGRIILLNGASSSGKSTLARQLQAALPTPFLVISSDMLAENGCLPPQRDLASTSAADVWSWQASMRPKFFSGFHRCVQGMAQAGNDVIVDHVVEYESWWKELRELLVMMDVWVVGVRCEIGEMERRERERMGRKNGEGRRHLENNRMHDIVQGGYDYEIDTTDGVSVRSVEALVVAWHGRQKERGCWHRERVKSVEQCE